MDVIFHVILAALAIAASVGLSAIDREWRRSAEDRAFRALDRAVADTEWRRAE